MWLIGVQAIHKKVFDAEIDVVHKRERKQKENDEEPPAARKRDREYVKGVCYELGINMKA